MGYCSRLRILFDKFVVTTNVSLLSLYALLDCLYFFFFFQAEDGIRDYKVTGVQTCALPILRADPNTVTALYTSERVSTPSTNSPMIRKTRHESDLTNARRSRGT